MSYMTKTIGKTLLLLALTFSCFANDILKLNVDKYLQTDLDYMFEIQSQGYSSIIVDCQSFLNAVKVERDDGATIAFYLDYGQCEDIHWKIIEAKKETNQACLTLDFTDNLYDISNENCKE